MSKIILIVHNIAILLVCFLACALLGHACTSPMEHEECMYINRDLKEIRTGKRLKRWAKDPDQKMVDGDCRIKDKGEWISLDRAISRTKEATK